MQRFTISLDEKLARDFDEWIAQRAYANRSEAVRDLLRSELERSLVHGKKGGHCVACLSYVFNHHERHLSERLTTLQHDHHELTVSTMHAHLDHEHCLETVILKGEIEAIQSFADTIAAERGVHHAKLNLISADLHEPHRPSHGGAGRSKPSVHGKGVTSHLHLKPSI